MASKDLPYAASGGAEPELNKDGAGSSWEEREGGVDGKQGFPLRCYSGGRGAEPDLNKGGASSCWVEREGGVDGK